MNATIEFNTASGPIRVTLTKEQWQDLRYAVDSAFLDKPLYGTPKPAND